MYLARRPLVLATLRRACLVDVVLGLEVRALLKSDTFRRLAPRTQRGFDSRSPKGCLLQAIGGDQRCQQGQTTNYSRSTRLTQARPSRPCTLSEARSIAAHFQRKEH